MNEGEGEEEKRERNDDKVAVVVAMVVTDRATCEPCSVVTW